MRKVGLKLWSVNEKYLKPAVDLFNAGIYDYIELYAVPSSYDAFYSKWLALQESGIPFLIHAPHFAHGLNLALKDKAGSNKVLAAEAFKWLEVLKAEYIIFHPGIGGDTSETVQQMKVLYRPEILVENKPYNIKLGPDIFCNGYSPAEIKYIKAQTGVGFCLDVGHAICAANGVKVPRDKYLSDFAALNPKLLHLSDGDLESVLDSHKHFGAGGYDFKEILSTVPKDVPISIETEKDSQSSLDDFALDATYLKKLF